MWTKNDEQADNDQPGPYLSGIGSKQTAGYIKVVGHENRQKGVQNPIDGRKADTNKHHFISETDAEFAVCSQFESPFNFQP